MNREQAPAPSVPRGTWRARPWEQLPAGASSPAWPLPLDSSPLPLPDADPPPQGWQLVSEGEDGYAAQHHASGLRAILSRALYPDDAGVWLHLSVSHRSGRMPSWPELVSVRDALLGPEVEAYQVAPPRSRYVNIGPGVLHLWASEAGPALPDFAGRLPDGSRTI